MKRTQIDSRTQSRRAAVNALKRARRSALRAGVDFSDWEAEFLGSLEARLETYGRAFADPEKGGAGQALSSLQGLKLKEIKAKAEGKPAAFRGRRELRSKAPADGR